MKARRKKSVLERYDLSRSPLSQKPTQKDLAELVRMTKPDLLALCREKERFVVRRDETIRGKKRQLIYPRGPLRRVHERLRFHCSKVRRPDFMMSPRSGVSTRDNALLHCGQRQFLTLDIRQFYPSTTRDHVYRWARERLRMSADVAELFSDLVTIDDRVSFGSPLTPVLVALVHAQMFENIGDVVRRRGLKLSTWVDDIVISGDFIRGTLLRTVRDEIAAAGLKSHKVKYLEGARAVSVTGIGVDGNDLRPPNALEIRIRDQYRDLRTATDPSVKEAAILNLLRELGVARFIVGRRSQRGVALSAQIARLRGELVKLRTGTTQDVVILEAVSAGEAPPW